LIVGLSRRLLLLQVPFCFRKNLQQPIDFNTYFVV
jgi:hypothetical protein